MLFDLLRTPSSFEGQPVAFARNQAGHAGVGMLWIWVAKNQSVILDPFWSALIVAAAWVVLSVGYAMWEAAQWRYWGGEDWDCVQDWAFVMTGAFVPVQPWLLVPMAGYLGAGYLRRADG